MCRYIVLIFVLSCASTLHAQTMRLDSIMSNDTNFRRLEKYVFRYDSLNRVVSRHSYGQDKKNGWTEYETRTYTYDDKGRVVSFTDTAHSGASVVLTTMFYDEHGNLLKKLIKNGDDDDAQVDSCTYTYDSSDRLTSFATSVHNEYPQKVEYEYNKKGILQTRKEYENIGTRIWKRDKIVDTPNPWKETVRDICDRDGRIIMHRDYNSGDTIRFEYSDGKLIKSERHAEGRITSKKQHYYDHLGNPISTDNYYEILYGGKTLEHAYTYTILYNKDIKAEDVAGIDQIFSLNLTALKNFTSGWFGDNPHFVNLPQKITSLFVHSQTDELSTTFHYSYIR